MPTVLKWRAKDLFQLKAKMNLKLDENFGTRTQRLFEEAGHDVLTMRQEGLQGIADQQLYEVCCQEQRCLVTLDLDFSDVTRFPPERTAGIFVIRVPRNPSLAILEGLVRQLLKASEQFELKGKLLIVEVGRIRLHQSEVMDEGE